jgi:thiamine kinase-like enzyme
VEEEEVAVDWEGAGVEDCVQDLPLPLLTLMGKWYIYA